MPGAKLHYEQKKLEIKKLTLSNFLQTTRLMQKGLLFTSDCTDAIWTAKYHGNHGNVIYFALRHFGLFQQKTFSFGNPAKNVIIFVQYQMKPYKFFGLPVFEF